MQAPADTRRSGRIRSETISTAAIFALAILLVLASRFVSPALGSWDQVDTIITLASFLIVAAFGQGLVILVGGLDLSIASMITLGGVLATTWNGSLGSEWVLIPAVLLICACVGALNAIGVIWLAIPPFIMTMASGIIVASAALGYTSGTPRGASPAAFLALSSPQRCRARPPSGGGSMRSAPTARPRVSRVSPRGARSWPPMRSAPFAQGSWE
jgi:ribose transport system permease protein